MRNRITLLLVAAWMAFGIACSSAPDPRPVAQDPVCLHNGDLGCINVRVDEATPRSTHQGKTYYFCTENCRKVFEKAPGQYVQQHNGKSEATD